VKIDSTLSTPTVGESGPIPATLVGEKAPQPSQPTSAPTPADAAESFLSSTSQKPQQLSVSYQLAENGHKVYFQVIDENSGQVVLQAPPSAVLSSEERLYQFLQDQKKAKLDKSQ
jgi:FlaG protein